MTWTNIGICVLGSAVAAFSIGASGFHHTHKQCIECVDMYISHQREKGILLNHREILNQCNFSRNLTVIFVTLALMSLWVFTFVHPPIEDKGIYKYSYFFT